MSEIESGRLARIRERLAVRRARIFSRGGTLALRVGSPPKLTHVRRERNMDWGFCLMAFRSPKGKLIDAAPLLFWDDDYAWNYAYGFEGARVVAGPPKDGPEYRPGDGRPQPPAPAFRYADGKVNHWPKLSGGTGSGPIFILPQQPPPGDRTPRTAFGVPLAFGEAARLCQQTPIDREAAS